MKRNTLNFIVDAISALVVLGLVTTGLLVRFVLPPGSGSRRLLWTMDRHEWGDVHFWLAVAGGAMLLLHVALHWQWACVTVLRLCHVASSEQEPRQRWRHNVAGGALVGFVILLFWGFVWGAQLLVRDVSSEFDRVKTDWRGGKPTGVPSSSERDGELIRGSMTLAEAATAGRMPVESLRMGLALPPTVSAGERLGRLSREYGFALSRVREVINEHQRRSSPALGTPPDK